jgi:hypothetical protein
VNGIGMGSCPVTGFDSITEPTRGLISQLTFKI